MSKMKQMYMNYCKGKIKDLGEITLYNPHWEEYETYRVIMTAEGLREHANVKIIMNENTEDNLVVIDSDNRIVINTPMAGPTDYSAHLEFNSIDRQFYENVINYWDDENMDEFMEGLLEEGLIDIEE